MQMIFLHSKGILSHKYTFDYCTIEKMTQIILLPFITY